ncbi:MAG: hypothetical protein K9K86_02050 [Pseudomonadales bacterium]|nr:hypothetical protein [Pseudomonadales bacterium]
MTNKQPRFNRRFLTILMMITAAAIIILSRLQPPPQKPVPEAPQPPATGTYQP